MPRQSRWVLRALWLIAGALAVAILTVRSKSILADSQQMVDRFKEAANLSFAVPAVQRDVPHSLDAVTWPQHLPVLIRRDASPSIPAGTQVTVSGWAFDQYANAPFAGVGAKVDGRPYVYYAIVHLPRADVANALHNSHATDSGFSSTIDTSNLPLGHHTILLQALTPDEKTSVSLGTVAFDIQNHAQAVQETDAIDTMNGFIVNSSASADAPIAVNRSVKKLRLDGWGFITEGQHLANSVILLVDGVPATPVHYGLPRADVASAYHDVRMTRSGFEATLPLASIPAGVHEIKFKMNLNDGTTVDSKSVLRFTIRDHL